MDETLDRGPALEKLRHFCAYQERCLFEVETKLLKINASRSDFDWIVDQLMIDNYLDEARFAIAYASGKFRIKKWGKIKIKLMLQQKRVPNNLIEKGLNAIDEKHYTKTLHSIIEKKLEELAENEHNKRDKLFKYAQNKGYEPNRILDSLEDLRIIN